MSTDIENNTASMQTSAAHQISPNEATAYATHRQPLLQRFTEKLRSRRDPSLLRDRRERAFTSSWWWWWEIGGAIVALVFLFAIIAVLKHINGTRTDEWHRGIQPASLLSVLTTVGKIGLALVVASCVSQLKWMHYQKPNHLSHLDLFDEASRAGPWSNAMMFVKVRAGLIRTVPNFLIALFAIVTLASFAIDPMIQMVLETPQREVQIGNITSTIMANKNYNSRAMGILDTFKSHNNAHANGTQLLIQESAFLSQLSGTALRANLYCPYPSTYCEFENVTVLGLCSNHSDISSRLDRSCERKESGHKVPSAHYLTCTFTAKDEEDIRLKRELSLSFGPPQGYTYNKFQSILEDLTEFPQALYRSADVARLYTIKVTSNITGPGFLDEDTLTEPETQVTMTNWYWCQQNYTKLSAAGPNAPINITGAVKTAPLLISHIPDTSDPSNVFLLGSSEEIGSLEDASNKPLSAASYSTNIWRKNLRSLFGLIDTKWPQYLDPNQNHTELVPQVSTGLNTVDSETYVRDAIGMASFMVSADIEQLAQNIAMAVTNQVQQSAHNANSDRASGTAWRETTFYHVRWAWITLPLLEAVAAFFLLIITIFLNTLPVLKSTNVGLLAHGPEDAVSYRVSGVETVEKWEKFSGEIDVVLAEDERGWLRLTRT